MPSVSLDMFEGQATTQRTMGDIRAMPMASDFESGFHVIARSGFEYSGDVFETAYDHRQVRQGEWVSVEGELHICKHGLHAATHASGALYWFRPLCSRNYVLCQVDLADDLMVIRGGWARKLVGRRRRIVQVMDVTEHLLGWVVYVAKTCLKEPCVRQWTFGDWGDASVDGWDEVLARIEARDVDHEAGRLVKLPVPGMPGSRQKHALLQLVRNGYHESNVIVVAHDLLSGTWRDYWNDAAETKRGSRWAWVCGIARNLDSRIIGEVVV